MRLFALVPRAQRNPDPEVQANRELVELVSLEIFRNELEPVLWSTAIAAVGADRQAALAEYARLRVRQLSIERPPSSRVFEGRLLKSGRRIRSVQDLLSLMNRGGRNNLPKPKLSVAWLALLMFGTTASSVCAMQLLDARTPGRLEDSLLLLSPLAGLAAVIVALLSRACLPKVRVRHDWNNWVAIAGVIACLGSLCLGSKLIVSKSPELIRHLLSDSD
jgi:hypothetical protein